MSHLASRTFALLAISGGCALAQPPASLESLLNAGRVDEAVFTLEGRMGANPFSPVALNNLAVSRAREGDSHTAMALLDRAYQLAPENGVIDENRAQLRRWLSNQVAQAPIISQKETAAQLQQLPPPPALWSN